TFESSQGTNGKVEFGNASTYGACTTKVTQTVTAWTDTEITITAVAGGLTSSQAWVYVTNDSEDRSDGYPFDLRCDWGLLSVETSDTTVNWARAMGGEPPDKDDMILRSASVYIGDSHSTQIRVAVYQGGSLSDGPDAEDGATLLKDFGQISGSATGTWIELTHEGADIPIDKEDPLWVAVKGTGSDTSVRYKGTPAPSPMDFQEDEGRYVSSVISSTETVAWPSTWPSDSGTFGDFWYSFKLSYEIAPSLVEIEGAFTEEDELEGTLSVLESIAGAFEESDQLSGTLSFSVLMEGAFEESDQVEGSIEVAAGLEGAFEESDQVEGTLQAGIEILDIEDERVWMGETGLVIDGWQFLASQGTGKVEFTNNAAYGSSTVIEAQDIDTWGDTQIIIDTIQGDLTEGFVYVYVTNDDDKRSDSYQVRLTGQWGVPSYATGDWELDGYLGDVAAAVGNPPSVDDMSLKSVSLYIGDEHSSQIRVGLYQGGSTSSPVGATLVKDFGQTTGSATETWITLTHVGAPIVLSKTALLWITIKENGSDTTFAYSYDVPVPSDYVGTSDTIWYAGGDLDDDEGTTFDSTWPTNNEGYFEELYLRAYITYEIGGSVELEGAFEESDDLEGSLSATVELAGAFEESDDLEGILGATVELTGAFEESDDLEGTLGATVELAGAFEESDQVEGTLGATVELAGAFEESDQVEGILGATVELAGAFEESDDLEGTLGATVELAGSFEESDDLEGSLSATVELAGAFEESDQVEGSIEIAAGLEGAFEESDQVEGTLGATVELAGAFEESDQVEGALGATVELAGAFEESDQVEGTLGATVELAGAFEESDQVEGALT
ncbi:MAG: hypothetical protein GY847_36080, partial [Proteobacteria bacterium]|nr:hypothetical protein [Pseudomonadota bacterium]